MEDAGGRAGLREIAAAAAAAAGAAPAAPTPATTAPVAVADLAAAAAFPSDRLAAAFARLAAASAAIANGDAGSGFASLGFLRGLNRDPAPVAYGLGTGTQPEAEGCDDEGGDCDGGVGRDSSGAAGGGGFGFSAAIAGVRWASAVAGAGSSVQRSLRKPSMSAAVTPRCEREGSVDGA